MNLILTAEIRFFVVETHIEILKKKIFPTVVSLTSESRVGNKNFFMVYKRWSLRNEKGSQSIKHSSIARFIPRGSVGY